VARKFGWPSRREISFVVGRADQRGVSRMTAARTLELLRALRTLELMARTIATVPTRDDTRGAWRLVREAIDDRCALLRAVLVLEADADVLVACDLRLAQEEQVVRDSQLANADYLTSNDGVDAITTHPRRLTIH
jgi:hypothetical protein